jgi:small-conductance mechanosensitive channel
LAIPYDLHLPVSTLLLALATGLVLELLAHRFPAEGLARRLLHRARLSLSLTLLLAGMGWWVVDRLGEAGWALPRTGFQISGAVLTLGLLWTLLRCKDTLIRLFLLDLADKRLSTLVALLGTLEVLRPAGVFATMLLTVSGIGAAAVGFRARSLVEKLLGSMMLSINRPFVISDQIKLPDRNLAGSVEPIGAYQTELITIDGTRLYIPKALFASFAITNTTRRSHRHLLLEIGLKPQEASQMEAILSGLRHTLHPTRR